MTKQNQTPTSVIIDPVLKLKALALNLFSNS